MSHVCVLNLSTQYIIPGFFGLNCMHTREVITMKFSSRHCTALHPTRPFSHDQQQMGTDCHCHCSGLVTNGHETTPVTPCAGVLASDSFPTAFSLLFLWKERRE